MIQKIFRSAWLHDAISPFLRPDPRPRLLQRQLAEPLDDEGSSAPPHNSFAPSRSMADDPAPECKHQFFDLLDGGPALLIALDRTNIGPCEEWLNRVDVGVSHRRSVASALRLMQHRTPQVSLLLIDLDSLGGIGAVIGDVFKLRDAYPGVPLILLSAEVPGSDFSTERLRLCDVTLRAPVSPSSLELAIVEAACNNLIWCGRERE